MKNYSQTRVLKLALMLSMALSASPALAQEATPAHDAHEGHDLRATPAARNGSPPAETEESPTLAPVVITAPTMEAPLEVQFNPKSPQQPLPSNDGGALLKAVPGMSLIRKGGTSGDPVFRGMAASRLNILLDGEQILGGCGGRMDPPTAYIFPDSYDRVRIIKGPQSVIYGPASAGTVLFERKHERFQKPGFRVNSALTAASFGRVDGMIGLKGGNETIYAEGIYTHARSDDYRDGNGKSVHSRYERWSGTGIIGLTPDDNTRIELSAVNSDGEAAYADRGMDGSRFRRENYAAKFEKSRINGWLDKAEAHLWRNYIDHVMDNYSLRKGAMMPMANNPDRETLGGRFALTLLPSENTVLTLGSDVQTNEHTARSGGPGGTANSYHDKPRTKDARFRNMALFSELTWQASKQDRLIGGLRFDRWWAKDERLTSATAKEERRETLTGGFVRYEREFNGATAYAGLGHSERAPDFWEIINKESVASTSAFNAIKPEKTTQLDVGANFRSGDWQGFASLFYGKINDYILIESQYAKGANRVTVARNVDATTWGGEAGVSRQFLQYWKASASVAAVRGINDSDGGVLGQIPPLEGRVALDWQQGAWSGGALLRLVAPQKHYARNQGNIVGQDLGKSSGFGVFSLNGGYRWNKTAQITLGVDNLFNKTYAEFISKSGEASMIQGYDQTTRVNEPGRTWWLRGQVGF
ncbi:MAG: TonB-dependent copper receptor [Azoarcus sp.]|jgi:iron complex outermembrane receptor protein|nr:TonB-dependent copper receptor [Azoarcus sp.]